MGAAAAPGDNPIIAENTRPGTSAWRLSKSSDDLNKQITGYADATSVNVGESIDFHVSVSSAQPFSIEIYRLGYYGGTGGRLMTTVGPLNGTPQVYTPLDPTTGMVEYDWDVAHRLTIPTDWVSGIYAAKLIRSDGYDNYIGFVVRNDAQNADLIFQRPILTDLAYNNFPNVDPSTPGFDATNPAHVGKSLYEFNSGGGNTMAGTTRAVKVSMNRPMRGDGFGMFFGWEYDTIRWLEQEGYNVTYTTNVDTDRDPSRLRSVKGFLSPPHDEYWTGAMRTAAEAARDAGTNLAFLGANSAYEQVRLEPGPDGTPRRTVVAYKSTSLDPEPVLANRTAKFRELGRAEQELVGVQYVDYGPDQRTDWVATNTDHWLYTGTGMTEGSTIPGIVGYEIDHFDPAYPAPTSDNYTVLAASPYDGKRGRNTHNASIYQATSGAWVFASGTLSWGWGLGRFGHTSPIVKKMTTNLLDTFITGTLPVVPGPVPTDPVDITFVARGTTGTEEVQLEVDGQVVQSWIVTTENTAYTHRVDTAPTDTVRVMFVNDGLTPSGADRNVLVLSLTVGSKTYNPLEVESKGVWNGTDCDIGFRNSYFLACNGWFRFVMDSPPTTTTSTTSSTTASTTTTAPTSSTTTSSSTTSSSTTSSSTTSSTTTPTTTPTTIASTTTTAGTTSTTSTAQIRVRLRGGTGTEQVTISVDGLTYGPWTVRSRWDMIKISVSPAPVEAVRVNYVNDGVTAKGAERDLTVDWIELDGRRVDAATLVATGVWDGTRCDIARVHGSGYLTCNGWVELPVG